jgi:hypothetical protein
VLPALGVLVLAVLVMAKSATGETVSVAVTKLGFEPTDVDKDPAGIVLITWGDSIEVTTTETEQLAPGGITVPDATVNEPAPAVAEGAGPEQVETRLVVLAFTKPVGYISVNPALNVADTSLWVFVKVITSKDVPPALIELGANVLDTCGKLNVTASLSVAEQVPPTHAVAVLVLVTLAGAVIEAEFVIWVCATANCGTPMASITPSTSTNALDARKDKLLKKNARQEALNDANEISPDYCLFAYKPRPS